MHQLQTDLDCRHSFQNGHQCRWREVLYMRRSTESVPPMSSRGLSPIEGVIVRQLVGVQDWEVIGHGVQTVSYKLSGQSLVLDSKVAASRSPFSSHYIELIELVSRWPFQPLGGGGGTTYLALPFAFKILSV